MNIQLILKSGERILIILLVATVLISLFSFYSLLSESVLSWLKGFIMGGAFAYGGYFLGTRIQKQGAINGLILMAIMIVISTIISLLLRENPLQMHSLIYKGLSAVLISLFSFYSLLSESVLSWLKGFIMGGAFAYGGYFLGTRIQKQGAINGLILMAIMIVISTIISLLLRENPLQMHSLIYKGLSAVIILLGMLIGLKRTKK